MIKKYAEGVVKLRWVLLILSVLFMLIAASGAKNLFFNNDYRIFFSYEDPRLQAFEELQNTYTKNDNVILVIAPKDGVVFKPETLTAIEDATERAWQTPFLFVSIRFQTINTANRSKMICRWQIYLKKPRTWVQMICPGLNQSLSMSRCCYIV